MAENKRPKLDGKHLLNPFFLAINKYYMNGDIRDLADLIRKQDIPQPFRETIALILLGQVTHDKASKGLAKSFLMKREYESLVAHHMPLMFHMSKGLPTDGWSQDMLDAVKPNYGKKEIIRKIAKHYDNDIETARRIIARKIKVEGWTKLPDF